MKDMKGYMRNLTKAEGNIVEGYIFDEALGLVTKSMTNFGATRRQMWDANEKEVLVGEVFQGQPKPKSLSLQFRDSTNLYVCENHETLSPWLG